MDMLGLEVVDLKGLRTTTSLKIPKELPTVEETLKMLAGALQAAIMPALDKVEVHRIQTVATPSAGMDEFAATLDRDTAKIVAYNLQKLARQQGKAVLAATTHTDLLEDLTPSVHIHKRYGKARA